MPVSSSVSRMSPSKTPTAKRRKTLTTSKSSKRSSYAPLVVYRYPFPYRLQNTLKYYELIETTTSALGFVAHAFSANGMYDPNITGVGHQPMYFDSLTPIYNHYHVLRSKIKVTPDRTASADNGVQYCIVGDDDAAPNANVMYILAERTGSIVWTADPSQGLMPSRTKYYDAKQIFGGNIVDNDTLKGSDTSNPTEGHFFIVGIEGPASTAMRFLVEIEYTVVWSELKSITGS